MKKVEKRSPTGVVALEEFNSYRARTDAAIAELRKTVTKLSAAIDAQNPRAVAAEKDPSEMSSKELAAAIIAAGKKARGDDDAKPRRYEEESWPPPGVEKLKEAARMTGHSASNLTKLMDAGKIAGWRKPGIWIQVNTVPKRRRYGVKQSVKKM